MISETELTETELKAALNQYLRMLKEAGVITVPKGTGHFDFAFAPAGEESSSAVAKPAPPEASLIVKESIADYVSNNTSSLHLATSSSTNFLSDQSSGLPAKDAFGQSSADGTPYPESLPSARRNEALLQLAEKVGSCIKCGELSRCRNRVVFGVGNAAPRLVFLGEAPGADEDRVGEPFVGAAGQLLNKIIEACKLSRSDVYILNTIKCRPPGNRNPAPDELENCWEFTRRQLEILRPEFICCLGLIATKQLLKTTQPLGQLRQKFHHYRDSRVLVTYHPAYLLRTESAKKFVWEDMKMLMREMAMDHR